MKVSIVCIDAESAPITNPGFWVFDIWNPEMSSTTSTTTQPPTTHTVTTKVNQLSKYEIQFSFYLHINNLATSNNNARC